MGAHLEGSTTFYFSLLPFTGMHPRSTHGLLLRCGDIIELLLMLGVRALNFGLFHGPRLLFSIGDIY